MLVPLQGAAAECYFRVLLLEWCVRFGGGLRRCRVPLQGAAPGRCRVICVLWSWRAGCCCRVRLQGAAVRVVCALWGWHVGAAAGCRRVLSECCVRWCHWCRCKVRVLASLHGGCEMSMAVWAVGPDGGDVLGSIARKVSAWLPPFAIWCLCRRN